MKTEQRDEPAEITNAQRFVLLATGVKDYANKITTTTKAPSLLRHAVHFVFFGAESIVKRAIRTTMGKLSSAVHAWHRA